jgi:6-phosphogluconolactonase (cycloisomerase 2 family)
MTTKTIIQLPAATIVNPTDLVPIFQGGNTLQATTQQIANLVSLDLTNIVVTGTATISGVVTAPTFTSTVVTGTAPFVVSSTTPVANLCIGGNAATSTTASTATSAATLTTPRSINGVNFNGATNITISIPYVDAAGTSDALTATFVPAITTIPDGLTISVGAASANLTTTPTLNVNGLAALTITKGANTPLAVGDILGANHEMILTYSAGIASWVLQNPAVAAAGASLSTMNVWTAPQTFNTFLNSSKRIIAPTPILNQGTGALTSITTAIASGANPDGVAVDPTGRFVYVANVNGSTVSMYSINQTTGALTSITTAIASGTAPYGIAVDPTGRFVYAVNFTDSTVSMYSISQTTGALTSITTAIVSGTNPQFIAVDPTGRFVYVSNSGVTTISMYSINQTTGALTSIATAVTSGSSPEGIAIDPTGRFVYVANAGGNTVSMFSINQTTGALTSITTAIASGNGPQGVAVDPTGRFVYVINYTASTVSMYSINQTTGALASITTAIVSGSNPQGITVDPTGKFVYVANNAGSTVSMYSINQTTGALTSITTAVASGTGPYGIAVDPTGRFVYVANTTGSTVSMYLINNFGLGAGSIAGPLGIGISPTATLQLKAGSASAATAPLKFTNGPVMTVAEAGAVEFFNDTFYATGQGGVRNMLVSSNTGRTVGATAAVASVVSYTTIAEGSFEVSANVLVSNAGTHSFNVTVSYTDEGSTARVLTMNFSTLAGVISNAAITNVGGASPYEGVPMHIRCKASTAITIATTGTFTTVTYNVEGSIRQIA